MHIGFFSGYVENFENCGKLKRLTLISQRHGLFLGKKVMPIDKNVKRKKYNILMKEKIHEITLIDFYNRSGDKEKFLT